MLCSARSMFAGTVAALLFVNLTGCAPSARHELPVVDRAQTDVFPDGEQLKVYTSSMEIIDGKVVYTVSGELIDAIMLPEGQEPEIPQMPLLPEAEAETSER